jgi:hypothetical protein
MVAVEAAIEPGKACAGFFIGQRISEILCQFDPSEMRTWRRIEGEQLAQSIGKTAGWLRVPVTEIAAGSLGGEIWHYSHGMIELHFSPSGLLFDISVFEGYRGLLFNSIGIGSSMQKLEGIYSLSYHDGEEVYIPTGDGVDARGISFYINEGGDVPVVSGISVFDFELA